MATGLLRTLSDGELVARDLGNKARRVKKKSGGVAKKSSSRGGKTLGNWTIIEFGVGCVQCSTKKVEI